MSILNVLPFFEPEIDAMVQGQILSFFFPPNTWPCLLATANYLQGTCNRLVFLLTTAPHNLDLEGWTKTSRFQAFSRWVNYGSNISQHWALQSSMCHRSIGWANLPNQHPTVYYIIIHIITKALVQSYLQAAFIKLPGLGGIKQCKFMVILRDDFPCNVVHCLSC